MKEPKTALYFYSLAEKGFNIGEYKKAIVNFKKSIELQEQWNSYHGLGWALYRCNRYAEAIDAFHKSLALKEDWNSYKGLGSALHNTYKFKEAIDAFRKSLALKEDWNSYKGLGSALHNTSQFKEAIEQFRKSLALKENWDTYRGLGLALFQTNNFKEAIQAFRKAFTLVDSSSINQMVISYRALANAYRKEGNIDASIRTWESFFLYTKPITSIDPFVGNEPIYEQVNREYLDKLKETCNRLGFTFIPSFEAENDVNLKSWKYLMFLHIPRSGGTSFEYPIHKLKQILVDVNRKYEDCNNHHIYFNAGESIMKNDQNTALINLTNPNIFPNLKSIYISTHGATWTKVSKQLSERINSQPRIVTTIRNPSKRLFSHIKNDAITHSLEEIKSIIDDKNSRYKNTMHKFIFDYGLDGSISSSFCNKIDFKSINDIEFIDISDTQTISKVKSAFLSASSLPNIVQCSRFHNSKDCNLYKLTKNEIKDAFCRCLDNGFLRQDLSINYGFLKRKTLNRLHFPSFFNKSISKIHPLTFVIKSETQYNICSTKQFCENPLNYL